MTTYSAIANTQIDQDSPITQPLMTALRDNPIALAEGATGAPRINGAAINRDFGPSNLPVVTVAAGEGISRQGEGFVAGTTSTIGTTVVVGVTYTIKSYSGVLRFKCTHTASAPVGGATSTLYLYKNDTLIQTYSTSSTAARVNDVSISAGDVIEWRHKAGSSAQTSSLSPFSVNADDPYVEQPTYRLQSEVLS